MSTRISISSMVDESSLIASVSVFLYGEGKVRIELEGDVRYVILSPSGVKEEFFISLIRLWQGTIGPELYTLKLEDNCGKKEVCFGLRNIGLSSERGFFLNGKECILNGKNTRIVTTLNDLDELDKKGIVAALLLPYGEEFREREFLNHPSLCFLGYKDVPSSLDYSVLKKMNDKLYSYDKTRPTMVKFLGEVDETKMKAFDITLMGNTPQKIPLGAIVFLQREGGFEFYQATKE